MKCKSFLAPVFSLLYALTCGAAQLGTYGVVVNIPQNGDPTTYLDGTGQLSVPAGSGGGSGSSTNSRVNALILFQQNLGTISGGGNFTLSPFTNYYRAIASGSTFNIVLPTVPDSTNVWWFRIAASNSFGGTQIGTIKVNSTVTALMRPQLSSTVPFSTFTNLSGAFWRAEFAAKNGNWSAFSVDGDALSGVGLSASDINTSAKLFGIVADGTGSPGPLVGANGPTINTPAIDNLSAMQHDHSNAPNGGQFDPNAAFSTGLAASNIVSGGQLPLGAFAPTNATSLQLLSNDGTENIWEDVGVGLTNLLGTKKIKVALGAGTNIVCTTNQNTITINSSALDPSRTINTTGPLSGGGALTSDLTLAVSNATSAATGVVKPDGTTITISSGTISAIATVSDVYTNSGAATWTNRAGAQFVNIRMFGGGGGGGSGRKGAAGTVRCAGGSGAGGCYTEINIRATILGATETVTVGAGGTGGSSQTTNSASGLAGTAGGDSTFGAWLLASGGGGGAGGTTGSGTAGTQGTGFMFVGGAAANASTTGLTGNSPASSSGDYLVPSGGGTGGGITSGDAASAGAAARTGSHALPTPLAAGTSGSIGNNGGNGGSAAAGVMNGGGGGGGGGSSTTGNAGSGGNGGNYGAGGGSGGSALDSTGNSGAGGNGAGGIIIVTTLF